MTQLMVCQEKNNILEFFTDIFSFCLARNRVALMEFVKSYDPFINSAAFYSENFASWRGVRALRDAIGHLF